MLKRLSKSIKDEGLFKTLSFILSKIRKKFSLHFVKKKTKKRKKEKTFSYKCLNSLEVNLEFYFSFRDKNKIKRFYDKNPKLKKEVIIEGEKVLEHIFNFLSDKEYKLGREIIWNKDFKSDYVWENKFYKNIELTNLDNQADVKIPWELSRFQHITPLGKAYFLTDDKKYYEEFKSQIISWMGKNPNYMSINWTCPMDVAIRAVNWISGYFFFEELIKEDKKFLDKFNNVLFEHGKYITKNLEKGLGPATNHYLADLNGLIFLGLYFRRLNKKESNKWLEFGLSEIKKEIFLQTFEDGVSYEGSTSYHRLATELFFYPLVLCEKNAVMFPREYKDRLKKMFYFMENITKKNGKVPIVGDIDNGRLMILSNYYTWDPRDFRDTLSLGGKYFNELSFKKIGASKLEDKLWMFSSEKSPDLRKESTEKSKEFPKGGYYILKNKNIYVMIRCGELGIKGIGNHSHNDQLSLEINVLGEDMIVDTGTGTYTSSKDIRNLFRSTLMHNSVAVDGYEQNNFDEDKLFYMKEQTFSKCLDFKDDYFIGEHYGYKDKIGSVHKRQVKILDKKIIIEDYLDFDGIVCFNLAENVKIKKQSKGLVLEVNKVKVCLDILENEYEVVDSFVSPKYGVILENKRIEIKFNKYIKLEMRVGEV